MRVLHVIWSIAPKLGGPSNILWLARAQARRGVDASVFTTDLDGRGELLPWREPKRLAVPTDHPVADQGVTVNYFRADWPSRYACSWPMARALREAIPKSDIVHIHSLYLFHGLAAAHICRQARIPYVVYPHGTLDPWHRRRRAAMKAAYNLLIENRNLRLAAAIHYNSSAEADAAREAGVRTPGFVVPQGVPPEEYLSLPAPGAFRRRHPSLAGRKLVVFLGRVTEKKGFDLLIPALARVAKARADLQLVIAGPDDEGYGDTVRNLIRSAGLEDIVTWTGMLVGTEKISLLRDADVWVLPSHDESFGMAAVEAMAAGAPVLITDRVAIHRDVARANAGVVVEPTIPAVASGLERLLESAELRKDIGESGRRLALDSFSWDGAARDLNDVYQEILSHGGRLPRSLHGCPEST